jgi:hypothetical protein
VQIVGLDGRRNLGRTESPALVAHRLELDPGQRRGGAALPQHAVGAVTDHHLFAGPCLDRQSDLIGHHPRGHVQRRLLAQKRRRALLERVHRRVPAVDVIAHLGARHRLPHRRRWLRHRVAAQIDHGCVKASRMDATRKRGFMRLIYR